MDGMLLAMALDHARVVIFSALYTTSSTFSSVKPRLLQRGEEGIRSSDLEYVGNESVASGSCVRLPLPQGWVQLGSRRVCPQRVWPSDFDSER